MAGIESYRWTDSGTNLTILVEQVDGVFQVRWNPDWGFDDRGPEVVTAAQASGIPLERGLTMAACVGRMMLFERLMEIYANECFGPGKNSG